MRRKWRGRVLFGLIFSLLLAGCGGEGDQPIAPPIITGTPEGLWSGTTSNGRTLWGAALDDGSYWFLYSKVGVPSVLGGAIHGTSQSENGGFNSTDARDFNIDEGYRLDGVITGSYVPHERLSGTMDLRLGGDASFTSAYVPTSEDVPDLAQVAGRYRGGSPGSSSVQEPASITISPDGSFTITGGGGGLSRGPIALPCFDSTGTLTPRAHGNVFDLTVTNLCVLANSEDIYRGVAIFDAATKKLSMLALDPDRTLVFLYKGYEDAVVKALLADAAP